LGSWIYHLRVAEALSAHVLAEHALVFTCGNLAPDSGRPNADWTAFIPPKEVTHFLRPQPLRPRIADLDYFRTYLQAVEPETAEYAFLLGYFTHLLADNLWIVHIESSSRSEHKVLFAERGSAAWNVLKEDWYDLDRLYLAEHPESVFWRMSVGLPELQPWLELLDRGAYLDQLGYICAYYTDGTVADARRSYPYLNRATMDRCVAESSRKIEHILAQLPDASLDDEPSALCLLTPDDLQPFHAPLGDVTGIGSA